MTNHTNVDTGRSPHWSDEDRRRVLLAILAYPNSNGLELADKACLPQRTMNALPQFEREGLIAYVLMDRHGAMGSRPFRAHWVVTPKGERWLVR